MEFEAPLKCDFYLPDHKSVIEYNGLQHYMPVDLFGGEEGLILTKKRDKIKAKWLSKNDLRLFVIKYDDDLDKIFSELDVIKELDETELNIEEEDDDISYDSDEDLDMIADEDSYDEDDDME